MSFPQIDPVELGEGEELVVYRIVEVPDSSSDEYVGCFRSRAELGRPPREIEQAVPLIWEGISVYDTLEAARRTARRFPAIGTHVAQLRITPELGVTYARWGPRGHLTVWGDALKLCQATVDTIPVDTEGEPTDGLHDSG